MPAETSNRYRSPALTDTLNDTYQKWLDRVPRWMDGKRCLAATPESDLAHVDGMINIINFIEHRFPNLAKAVDLAATREIVYYHDGGEILTGDILAVENRKTKREREQRAVDILTGKRYFGDEEKGRPIRDIYARYDNCRPEDGLGLGDREALLTHLVDKVQAVRFGINNVVRKQEGQTDHLYFNPDVSSANILKFTLPLLEALPNAASKCELIYFVYNEFEQFKIDFHPTADSSRKVLIEYARNHALEL